MAGCRGDTPGGKPLSEPIMVRVPRHICVTRPQWVKCVNSLFQRILFVSHMSVVLFLLTELLLYRKQLLFFTNDCVLRPIVCHWYTFCKRWRPIGFENDCWCGNVKLVIIIISTANISLVSATLNVISNYCELYNGLSLIPRQTII